MVLEISSLKITAPKKIPIFDPVLKKCITILLVSLAYTIQFGHNIISHHHRDSHSVEHHPTNHHHEDEHEDDGLKDIFSYFIHSCEGFDHTLSSKASNLLKQQLLIVGILPNSFLFDYFTIPPLLDKPPAEQFIYISPQSLVSGLRAPPAFIA